MLAEVDDISARLKNIVESYRDQNYPNPVKVSITYFHQCLNRNHRYIDRYFGLCSCCEGTLCSVDASYLLAICTQG
jgi:hypothetical protein